jgi:4-phospho-D-threonate 3-dehydrogenase / 4-phospho-D-erythronate 3-dehydrogenase
MKKPVIGITAGDPAGIGPEIALKALLDPGVRSICEPVVFGSLRTLEETARHVGIRLSQTLLYGTERFIQKLAFGRVSAQAGREAMAALDAALLKIKDNTIDALVTAPLSKEAVVLAGFKGFSGHTEYLSAFGGNPSHALALYSEGRAIAFATCHVSVKQAIREVRKERIVTTGLLLHDFLKRVRGGRPRIAVSGLNPHAGEGGLFGREEQTEVLPAIKALAAKGLLVSGPVPPDVVFPALFSGRVDGVVSLLHDHGHVAFKTALFRLGQAGRQTSGVNVTLGLPFIRTSADHGTAFDIAGKGCADAGSLKEAVALAVRLTLRRIGR